ncbi:MAG: 30S ribosomal protein S18 [Candidatus Omnitrophota bacterium]|jgi:small subunit ribosomal protein S18|nr:30S ribosomal protein S18 [Elusimicrobiota bacterium]
MKEKIRKTPNRNKRRKDSGSSGRKRICRFCADKMENIDYKDIKRLEFFMRDRGKIVSSRLSGNCAKHQRRLVTAIKRARFLALLPYSRA